MYFSIRLNDCEELWFMDQAILLHSIEFTRQEGNNLVNPVIEALRQYSTSTYQAHIAAQTYWRASSE